MSFEVIVAPDAFDRLAGIPAEMIQKVRDKIVLLSEEPLTRGRKAVFPFLPIGHIFDFHIDNDKERYRFTIFFLFGPSDHQISITDAIVSPRFSGT